MPENENACPTCDHVRADGSVCMSPALNGGRFCYYHTRDRQRRRNLRHAADLQSSPAYQSLHAEQLSAALMRSLELPDLEDATAVQVSLSSIIRALAYGHLEPRRAALMIRALRAAVMNLRNLPKPAEASEVTLSDDEPIAPLIQPCAPEAWEMPMASAPSDCHPEERSDEGPLPSSEIPSEQETGKSRQVEEPETRNEERIAEPQPANAKTITPETRTEEPAACGAA